MDCLVIGSSSQLACFFPDDHVKISSRDIDYGFIRSKRWDRAYLCFAEQRTFLEGKEGLFIDVNYSYTMEVINQIRDVCGRIVYYSTTYLWNDCEGAVDLTMPFHYEETPYIRSKEMITRHLMDQIGNAVVLFPCNFNSPFRKKGFLFQKIFDSIVERKPVTIGNTHFQREMVHPRYVVQESLKATGHRMIGAGYAIDVNAFIRDLYKAFDLKYETYVTEEIRPSAAVPRTYWTKKDVIDYTREDLLRDTVRDLEELTR